MVLRDQCVALAGLVCVVFSMICGTVCVEMKVARPGLLASLATLK
jgi:hypothetical protein